MSNFISSFNAFLADENGVTAIEYGLVAALIGTAIIAAATTLGGKLNDLFVAIGGALHL
jgi:pilus assembly protein Flp/PilA